MNIREFFEICSICDIGEGATVNSDIGMSSEGEIEERFSSLRDEKDFRLADHKRAALTLAC